MATLTEEQIEKRKQENLPVYKKTCKADGCGKEFYSDSRNQRYCCSECSDNMQVKRKKKEKTRRRKRREYDENKEINRALSKAYSLCATVFELYKIPKVCACKEFGYEDECKGELERHHKDGNPFNNSPWNLCYLCRRHHAKADDEHATVNMVETYKEALDEAGFEDDDKKHIKMIAYTRAKIRGENDGNQED